MNQEFVRMFSVDEVELPGILYCPKNGSDKIVIHVHGLDSNFYENHFIDDLAKIYVQKGYAFLAFNNRGRDLVAELIQGEGYAIIGGCFERFQDSLLDIEGVVGWVQKKGYQHIVLEGHSYGCNKVLYYFNHANNQMIQKIVLLAPCDVPFLYQHFLDEKEYTFLKNESRKFVKNGKERELLNFSMMANGKISAGTFYYDFLPNGENDFIRYNDGENGISDLLKQISVPILVVFGSQDVCVLTTSVSNVVNYLKNNIRHCDIEILENCDHSFTNKGKELADIINKNF